MAHIRKPLAAAVGLNTAVCVAEAAGGLRAQSLSLLVDAAHNCSDELALVCVLLAYVLKAGLSRNLQRTANGLNSLGLVAVSGVVAWFAVDRLLHPEPVVGWLPAGIGLLSALGNWGVAACLRPWTAHSPAIRLAYLHNVGDAYLSLAPAAAGLAIGVTGRSSIDALVALAVGAWLLASTLLELRRSSDQLLWPEQARCPHEDLVEA